MSWDNFVIEEFDCKHSGKNNISHDLIDRLQSLRDELGFPFIITSGYRSKEHPIEKAKANPGVHTLGLAADIKVSGKQAYEVISNAAKHGFTGIGINQKGNYNSRFIHLDIAESSGTRPRPHIWSY